jgi:stress responsive alpha/beta barrel protein
VAAGLRHVVMFRWKQGTGAPELAALARALEMLPEQVTEILRYRWGRDEGLVQGNFDFAIVADFADRDSWKRYQDHPAHQKLISERIRPIVAERAAVQMRVELD